VSCGFHELVFSLTMVGCVSTGGTWTVLPSLHLPCLCTCSQQGFVRTWTAVRAVGLIGSLMHWKRVLERYHGILRHPLICPPPPCFLTFWLNVIGCSGSWLFRSGLVAAAAYGLGYPEVPSYEIPPVVFP